MQLISDDAEKVYRCDAVVSMHVKPQRKIGGEILGFHRYASSFG
ncbi:hypothetical protein [Pelagibacterium sp. H642]|nr:hypothetical protein [Pelagibacterium sp. H642]WMT91908.1 hypothetical protein NO934_06505 [Pelagibacterium sp. H642]